MRNEHKNTVGNKNETSLFLPEFHDENTHFHDSVSWYNLVTTKIKNNETKYPKYFFINFEKLYVLSS